MGATPFSDLFRVHNKTGSQPDGAHSPAVFEISEENKLGIIHQLEETGVSWFWATDAQGNLVYLSQAIAEKVQDQTGRIAGRPLQKVLLPVETGRSGRSLGLMLGSRKPFVNLTVRAGSERDGMILRLSGQPLFEGKETFEGFRGSAIDITEEYRAEEEAARMAQYDSLTGLANRHRMERCIDATLNAFRDAERSCALLMLDLDRFKQVNDTLGHAAGDQLLQQVAERLRSALGSKIEIGRLGGDEFQAIVPDLDDRGQLGEMAKKVIAMISQPYSVEEGRCTIGTSVGIAIAPYDGVNREELSRSADLALYAAKNGGRGQFRFYAADLEHDANLRKRMEEDLNAAMESGAFSLDYQPVVALDRNHVVALATQYRWEDEERGVVSPDTFLPVAEGSRLIIPIGEWALRTACAAAVQWPDAVRIAMGISPVQFAASNFAEMVSEVLDETGLEPGRLELELEEAIFQGDLVTTEKTLAALFKLGVRLTLDNFGTGFTSLSHLRRAPFTALKIGSQYFEPSINREHGDMEMVSAIVRLGEVMGMQTCATGVHALDLLERLKEQGVDQVQGLVFSPAMPAEDITERIQSGEWVLDPTDAASQRASRRTVFRRIGLIHEDCYYDVTLRNLSRSGAMIQGLVDVPVGTQFVLDFGGGQLAVAAVVRSMDDTQGVEFETELVDDGAGGLCTRHRVSPYSLAAAGAPLSALPPGKYSATTLQGEQTVSAPQFALSANAPEQTGPRNE